MNSFGVIVVVLVGIMILLMVIRLGISINSTRRMSGQGRWSDDGADIPGGEPRGIDHRGHHES